MRLIATLLLALAAFSQAAVAQDPPTRVGRLAYTEGTVALYQDPDLGWEKAYVNSPVTTENSIWTDPGSRAEMRVAGMVLRLHETTQLDIARLDEDDLQAFVSRGSVAVRVRHFNNSERLDFATPHAAFRLYGTGRYRIDVDPERDETILTVFTGSASMRSASGDIQVSTGAAIRVVGGPSPHFVRLRARSDAFDRWTLARDDRWIERRSTRYVSTDMTGYEDLDAYGEWYEEPEFGAIWFPTRVSRDWAPYRHGRWDWVRPWGWTWVADEPWGYAPYHYGRWVYVRDRWGWYPGRREARPVWAPALVAWVGGSNFSVGISSGRTPAVGWYPLAPWERYDPWYRTDTTYVNRINVVVSDRAPRQWAGRDRSEWRYANRDRGATVVRRETFTSGRPVNQAVVPVTQDVIRQAPVATAATATTVLPGREEFRRNARVATQPPTMPGAQAPATAQAPQPQQQQGEAPFRRPGERGGPAARPSFERRQAAPAPAPATAAQQQQQPAQQAPAQAPAAAPATSPVARDDQRTRERAAREQQQAQERAAREQQQAQERAAREQQQAQERAARDARQQRTAPAPAPAPGASPMTRDDARTQERAAREQQQAQEKAQRDAQQAQQQQQQQQRQAAEKAQRDAQQAQQQQRQAQEKAQRDAQQAQEKAQRDAQQVQERAAREAQQRARQAPAQPPAQPAPPPPAPKAAPPAQDKPEPKGRGRDRDKDKDDEEKGRGKGRN